MASPFSDALELKNYTQPNIFLCGPTALYLIMDYWGLENIDFKRLSDLIFSKSIQGTANSNIVFYPHVFGMKSYSFTGNMMLLKKLLTRRIPVIVLQNLSNKFKIGHFRIVVGMESLKHNEVIYVRDPAKKRIQKMRWNKFESLWKRGHSINNNRWAMIIVPEFYDFKIDEIYHSPLTELNMGTYYYRNFDYLTACHFFKKAYKKDNQNRDVLQYYAQGLIRIKEYEPAFEIITRMLEMDPDNPVAYDLKALTLFYQGHYRQSLIEIEKAVKLNKEQEENSFIKEHYQLIKRFVREKEKN